MNMMGKEQLQEVNKGDIPCQATFISNLFKVAA